MATRAATTSTAANHFLRLADQQAAARCARERSCGPAAESVEIIQIRIDILRAAADILKGHEPDTALVLTTPGGAVATMLDVAAAVKEAGRPLEPLCSALEERADLLHDAAAISRHSARLGGVPSIRLSPEAGAAAANTAVRTAKRLDKVCVLLRRLDDAATRRQRHMEAVAGGEAALVHAACAGDAHVTADAARAADAARRQRSADADAAADAALARRQRLLRGA